MLDWANETRPFLMLPVSAPWPNCESQIHADRRVRHLAAAFLWTVNRTDKGASQYERILAASCAEVLDHDAPARPALWTVLVRAWLRPRFPHYRMTVDRTWPPPLGAVIAALYRSRRHRGLAGVLEWAACRSPVIFPRPLPAHVLDTLRVPALAGLIRDVYPGGDKGTTKAGGRPRPLKREWLTDTVVTLARQMWEAREYSAMPILADALQDAGCDSHEVLDHCRDPQAVHCRGCWVLDLVLAGAKWVPVRWNRPPVRNDRGEALTRCVSVPGHPEVYDVHYRAVTDPDDATAGLLTRAELDARFPGWITAARPAPDLPLLLDDHEQANEQEADADEDAGRPLDAVGQQGGR